MTTPVKTRYRVLRYIQQFVAGHGYGPTVREIQAALELSSTSVVQYHLDRLERQWLITREPGLARTIHPAATSRPGPAKRRYRGA